ncbi:hypothetical protein PT273_08575 [Orbaceae bacterium ESL0727]|nr:hypothetical protein [Orbaceae bacterium ESL0727]
MMNSEFFERPYWQQHLLIAIISLFLLLFSYFYWVVEMRNDVKQYQQQYQNNGIEIDRIQKQLARYDHNRHSVLTVISEHEFANLIARHKLALQLFNYSATDESIYWTMELQGEYVNFMALLNTFFVEKYYFNFQDLTIQKQDEQTLKFIFTLVLAKRMIDH